MLMYAERDFPVLPSWEAGPLNGKVAPALISFAVTPGDASSAAAETDSTTSINAADMNEDDLAMASS
jgi:hypothetical protein